MAKGISTVLPSVPASPHAPQKKGFLSDFPYLCISDTNARIPWDCDSWGTNLIQPIYTISKSIATWMRRILWPGRLAPHSAGFLRGIFKKPSWLLSLINVGIELYGIQINKGVYEFRHTFSFLPEFITFFIRVAISLPGDWRRLDGVCTGSGLIQFAPIVSVMKRIVVFHF